MVCPDKVSVFQKQETIRPNDIYKKRQIIFQYGTCHKCGQSRANLHVCDLFYFR